MLRSRALDVLTGAVGFGICAAALLLQSVSQAGFEYGLIVLPVVVFPALTWIRIAAGSSRWFAFLAVNLWFLAVEAALARLAFTSILTLLLPLIIGLAGSAVIAIFRSPPYRTAVIALAAVAGILIAPGVWNGMLSSSVSMRAPDVSLMLLDGRRVRLADLHGKVVVLNFWGVWCGPCVQELPELATFAHQSAADVIAVNSGIGRETPDDVARFMRAHNLNLTVALDPSRTAYHAFGVTALPTTVIIDPRGIVRERRVGFAATAHFEAWLSREAQRLARG